MTWLGRLATGTKKFFGRQLPHFAQGFGRTLSHVAGDIGHGLGSAQGVVSALEKPLGGVPILGSFLKTADAGLGLLKNGANAASSGGTALSAIAGGNKQLARQAGNQALSSLSNIPAAGSQFVSAATPLAATLL